MSDFTGVGLKDGVEKRIKYVLDSSYDTLNNMMNELERCLDDCKPNWCSANAVQFGENEATNLVYAIHNGFYQIKVLCLRIQDAYNSYTTTGADKIDVVDDRLIRLINTRFAPESDSGDYGIRKYSVINAWDAFNRVMKVEAGLKGPMCDNGYLSRLNNLNDPYFIFFDPDLEQSGALANLVLKVIGEISEALEKANERVNYFIENEIEMTDKAAKQAEEELRRSKWNWNP